MCKLLAASTSGYYKWIHSHPSARAVSNILVDKHIKIIFSHHHKRYGYRRIYKEIIKLNILVSKNRVRRRMIKLNLYAVVTKKYKTTTKSCAQSRYANNILDQDFQADYLNHKWVSDITQMKINGRKLYLAVIVDLCSRMVIGWSMSNRMTASIVIGALNMAMRNRGYPKGVILHSDRGSQYISTSYQKLITHYQLKCSMSAKGCCYDNAACESFFATLKKELIYATTFSDVQAAKNSIFQYIEAYYNRVRLHSSIDYYSPLEFELKLLNIAA